MRIFGKHIFRSIKANPRQPIMITAIVCICTIVMILLVALSISIYKNERGSLLVDEWTADLEISLKATSDRRLIFEEEIADAVGDRGCVIGQFSLTGLFIPENGGNKYTVEVGAFDILEADSFYNIQYLQYGKFTNNNLKSSTIIAESFADEYSISIGDTVKIKVIGQEFVYTVQAIAKETGIMKRKNMLVDISSVRCVLSERSPLIASLSSDFNPYTRAHVKVNDGLDVDEVKAELEAMSLFADKTVEIAGNYAEKNYTATIFTITLVIPAILLLIVAAFITVSTFDLLQKQRRKEAILFKIVGADTRQISLMLYIESAVYGLVGGLLGTIIATSLADPINRLYKFKYFPLHFGIRDVIIGVLSSLLYAIICTFIYEKKYKDGNISDALKDRGINMGSGIFGKMVVLGAAVILLAVTTALLPTDARYIGAFSLLFAVVLFVYMMTPCAISAYSALISRVLSKRRRVAGDFIIGAKSCSNSYALCHAGRIITLIITVFLSLISVLSVVTKQLNSYVGIADFEHIGVMADDETKRRVEELEGVVATAEATIAVNVVLNGGKVCTGISATGDIERCFTEDMLPETMPNGNTIALSTGVVKMIGLTVGDTVKCEIGDIPCELILAEIVDANGSFAYYDAEYLGVGHDMLCVVTDGSDEAYQELVALFDERGVTYLSKGEFFAYFEGRVNAQVVAFKIMLCIMMLMAIVGVFNVIADQRMARRQEFKIMMQNGKTRRGVLALQATEILYLLVFSIIVSAILSHVLCLIIDIAAISFGMTLYA